MTDFDILVKKVSKTFFKTSLSAAASEEGLREQLKTAKGKYKVIFYFDPSFYKKTGKLQIVKDYFFESGERCSFTPDGSLDKKFIEFKKKQDQKFKHLQEECLKEWPFHVPSYPF